MVLDGVGGGVGDVVDEVSDVVEVCEIFVDMFCFGVMVLGVWIVLLVFVGFC